MICLRLSISYENKKNIFAFDLCKYCQIKKSEERRGTISLKSTDLGSSVLRAYTI